MKLEEAKEKINISIEEEQALKRYQGFWHTKINTLCDLDPEIYKDLNKSGWMMLETKEEVEKAIQDFVNIYSAMYKNSRTGTYKGHLVRGTGNSDVSRLSYRNNQFLSTTTSEEIAKTFSHYGDDAILRISLGEGVPYIDMSNYQNENSRDEHEILVAPFCDISGKRIVSKWEGYTYYSLGLDKPELKEKSQSELEELKESILNGFEENLVHMKNYLSYKDKVELCDERLKRTGGDKEYQRELSREKRDNEDKMTEERGITYDFKLKVRDLLEGLCRQKEIEIDKAYEVVREDNQKRKEEGQRKKTFQTLEDNIEYAIKDSNELDGNLGEFYRKLSKKNEVYKVVSERLQLVNNSESKLGIIKQKIDEIKQVIETVNSRISDEKKDVEDNSISVESATEKTKGINQYQSGINIGTRITNNLNELSTRYGTDLEEQLKENIMVKASRMIRTAKIAQYMQQYKFLEGQKIGFFRKAYGKGEVKTRAIDKSSTKNKRRSNRTITNG